MTWELILEPEAEVDLENAMAWYEDQRINLGDEFMLTVEATLAEIRRRPESFKPVGWNVRRATVRRFPYGIFFIVQEGIVHVIAVIHAKRNPAIWKRRQRPR
jgi:toxin ParE1/3/4